MPPRHPPCGLVCAYVTKGSGSSARALLRVEAAFITTNILEEEFFLIRW
jgi:hypothetical protein